jgi:hypothetical protein
VYDTHPLFIYFKLFAEGLKCQVIAWEVYSWFLNFNILIIRLIYDYILAIHLVLFDFAVGLFDVNDLYWV